MEVDETDGLLGTHNHKNEKIGFWWSVIIIIAVSIGLSTVLMPYFMIVLGPVIFVISSFMILFIFNFVGILLKDTIVHALARNQQYEEDDDIKKREDNLVRHTLPTLALLVLNKKFSVLVQVTFYVLMVSSSIGILLGASTTLDQIITVDLSYYNRIRMWLVIMYTIATPFLLINNYKESRYQAMTGVVVTLIALAVVLVISSVYMVQHDFSSGYTEFLSKTVTPIDSFFITFGNLIFLSPISLVPNIIIEYENPRKFGFPLAASLTIIFCAYVISAMVPYAAFRDLIKPNLLETLYKVYSGNAVVLGVLKVVQICLVIHYLISSSMMLLPVFTSIEISLGLPNGE